MPLPLGFFLQEGKVKGLEESYEKWKKEHAEAMQALDMETLVEVWTGLVGNLEQFWRRTWDDLNKGHQPDESGGDGSVH